MATFGKERFNKAYQQYVGQNASKRLHDNSIEMFNILNDNIDIKEKHIFEIGSGGCRNLYYIWKNIKNVRLSASDLFRNESMAQTHDSIKGIVKFYEGDSEDIVNTIDFSDVDVVLFSDHLMHLQYEKADAILKKLNNDIKPEYIYMRELKKEFETPNHPRLYHDYAQLETNYDLVAVETSKQDSKFFIHLYKLRG